MTKSLFALSLIAISCVALADTPKALETHSTKAKTQKECCFKCCGIVQQPIVPQQKK